MATSRYIIGKGELLAMEINHPPMMPNKIHPYTLQDAQQYVIPQIITAALDLKKLPESACPNDIAVAKLDFIPLTFPSLTFQRPCSEPLASPLLAVTRLVFRRAETCARKLLRFAKRPDSSSLERAKPLRNSPHWPHA